MLSVYFRPTGTGGKIPVVLEKCRLSYNAIPMNINRGERSTAQYAAAKPNNRMAALIEQDAPGSPLTSFESGAILEYLGEQTGRLRPAAGRYRVLQWVYCPVGGPGPMAGQARHFPDGCLKPTPCAYSTSGP